MATKTKIKQIFDVKTVDTPSDLVPTNDAKSVYPDQVLTKEEVTALSYHENVIEKGLETFIEVGQSLQYIRDNRLYRAEYKSFKEYIEQRWHFQVRQAHRIITGIETTQLLTDAGVPGDTLPNSEKVARPLAKLKDDPELMAQAWIELTGKTQEEYEEGLRKSAQPTHKEVEAKVKEYEAQIESLKNNQTSLTDQLNNAKTQKDKLKETIKNQNRQIKELNGNISAKENELKNTQTLKTELEEKQKNLDSFIIAQASVIATEEINKEKKVLATQMNELKAKEEKIQKELKQAKSLRITAQKQKENFDLTTQWLNSFQLTNEYLNEITGKLKQYKKELEKTPDLSQFDDEEKANLEKAIQDQVVDFNDNLHSLGGAINYLNGTIVKFNNHALRVINAEVNE